jgi:hypothetical protein
VPPDADAYGLLDYVRNQVDLDLFTEFHVGDLDGVVEQRDSAISIDNSGLAQAKDILG